VTVQLPLYNEPSVVERIIDAAANLDWPRARLQNPSAGRFDRSHYSAGPITCGVSARARRGPRADPPQRFAAAFKAGALANGLRSAKGEFVAIFDADFTPAPDFLQRMMPHFVDNSIGFVQARWEHLATSSPFARGLAIGVDGTSSSSRRRAIARACR